MPTSLMNPEIILPAAAFKAAHRKRQGCIDDSWSCDGKVTQTYVLDGCETQLDWHAGKKDLERPQDLLDEIDYEVLYLQDYDDKMPDLKSLVELEGLVYEWLGATLAFTTVSTDTKAATESFGLSMGMPGTLACSTLGALPNLWVQALA